MAKDRTPKTAGLRALDQARAAYRVRVYRYEEHGGTEVAARELGVEEHRVIKTLVMEDHEGRPVLVLMHGDRQVSTKALARQMGVKSVAPCTPEAVRKFSGYQIGGVSPFGTRTRMPVFVQESILDLPVLLINGGRRGLLVEMTPADLKRVLSPTPVDAAL
ncbi:MAG: aminoacyl-tRNA deacylase [Proteobacteria bacterium]|nr:aminoacyl-tRNA deacylase [Pseudomonadota bacterium]